MKAREISTSSIIEDLIAETVSSPLLESARKEQLIHELSKIHYLGTVIDVIKYNSRVLEDILKSIDETEEMAGSIDRLKEQAVSENEPSDFSKRTELFGLISGLLSVLAVAVSITGFSRKIDIFPKLMDSSILTSLSLGMFASLVAGFLTAFFGKKGKKKDNVTQKPRGAGESN